MAELAPAEQRIKRDAEPRDGDDAEEPGKGVGGGAFFAHQAGDEKHREDENPELKDLGHEPMGGPSVEALEQRDRHEVTARKRRRGDGKNRLKNNLNSAGSVEKFRVPLKVGYSSGQRGRTVNPPAYAFLGSNPSPTTTFSPAVPVNSRGAAVKADPRRQNCNSPARKDRRRVGR